MRARMLGLVVLLGIVALTTGFTPPAMTPLNPPVYGELSKEESDCQVGGLLGCFEAIGTSAMACALEEGLDPTDPEATSRNFTAAEGVYCLGVGLWSGAVCAIDWFFSLF